MFQIYVACDLRTYKLQHRLPEEIVFKDLKPPKTQKKGST